MTSATLADGKLLTEDEYLELGETPERIELFDGRLVVTPAPTKLHRRIQRRLANLLDREAENAGLEAHEAVNVRLRRGRLAIPDVVVARATDPDGMITDAADTLFVCEILSPSNATYDIVTKSRDYASAGIPWYLIIDPLKATMRLYRLDGIGYAEHAAAEFGETLELNEPVHVIIDPAALGLVHGLTP